MTKKSIIISITLFMTVLGCNASAKVHYDLVIVGGGASGVSAGIQAARMGTNALIVEETPWLGGMLTSAGVSAIDGNYNLPGGIWGEFKDALTEYYGGDPETLKSGWVSNVMFEPSTGNKILKKMCNNEKNLTVWMESSLKSIKKGKKVWNLVFNKKNGKSVAVTAKIVIDATELGDVAKTCGVKYDVGMESRNDTHEDIAPLEANNIVQDLTYVAIVKDYGKDVTIPRPHSYNPAEFACTCINDLCKNPQEPERMRSKELMITYGELPNKKFMLNWPIEGNDYYLNLVEMTPRQRNIALKQAKEYTLCYLYFMQHELGFNTYGLADDEFPTPDRLPFIPYHRESRRIHGLVRFNLNHVTDMYNQPEALYRTCIAVGDYPVDHHHRKYQGVEKLPNLFFHAIPSYGLPLGTLIPKNVDGLIVAEKSISVSNIINGTTRLQPVVIQIGQAAGTLAALSISQGKDIKDVKVRDVQNELLNCGSYLLPYLDVNKSSKLFKPLQRIGSTGILHSVGRNVEWSNQTWLRADTLLLANELKGIKDVYPAMTYTLSSEPKNVTLGEALMIIENAAGSDGINTDVISRAKHLWNEFGFGEWNVTSNVKRGEMAVLIDQILDPFNRKDVDITGKYTKE